MHHLGCWKDAQNRAIAGSPQMLYDPETAVELCRIITEGMGYNIFGLQNSMNSMIECYISADAGDTYQKYGAGTGCTNGRGGLLLNDVYEKRCLGTYKDTATIFRRFVNISK